VALIFFDLTMLVPSLLQASSVSINPQGIVVTTLLWKSKLSWVDILWFHKPSSLGVAVIRSKKCLYLLAKRDFVNFDELIRVIASRAGANT
jgi:hypothetical protein